MLRHRLKRWAKAKRVTSAGNAAAIWTARRNENRGDFASGADYNDVHGLGVREIAMHEAGAGRGEFWRLASLPLLRALFAPLPQPRPSSPAQRSAAPATSPASRSISPIRSPSTSLLSPILTGSSSICRMSNGRRGRLPTPSMARAGPCAMARCGRVPGASCSNVRRRATIRDAHLLRPAGHAGYRLVVDLAPGGSATACSAT